MLGKSFASLAAAAGMVTEQSSQRYSWAVGRLDDMYAGPKSPMVPAVVRGAGSRYVRRRSPFDAPCWRWVGECFQRIWAHYS